MTFRFDLKECLTWVTWVTFSVTFWVRSFTLLGAMISISAGEGGLIPSEPKVSVTWGMRPMVRSLIRSESEVEFGALDLKSVETTSAVTQTDLLWVEFSK